LRKNSAIRHSEERSDEESLFLLAEIQEGFLALLGMTDLVYFSASSEAAPHKDSKYSHRFFSLRGFGSCLCALWVAASAATLHGLKNGL
jgi:hypothetical protein